MNEMMKTIDKFAILWMLAAAFTACGQDPAPEPEPVDPTETRTLTFVLPDYPVDEGEEAPVEYKTAWVAGDQIVVHGEYAKDQVTVTLEAGDISADGKTATKTVDGLIPYVREDYGSVLYAAYPASAVNNLKHCFFYSAFVNANETQLMAACNHGDSFAFQNLSAAFSFVVEGDFDSFNLVGRKEVTLGYSSYQVKVTDKDVNLKQYLQEPSSSVVGPVVADGETVNVVFIPGGANLKGGFILQLLKDGEAIMGITDKTARNIPVGTVLALGDITDELTEVGDDVDPDLATPIDGEGNANSYIIFTPGIYRFKATVGNTAEAITGGARAVILWESCGTSEEMAARSVVKAASYDNEGNNMCFQTPDPIKPGNALIALLDKNEKVLWSWHIWIPETAITVSNFGYASGCKIMSRNLGALIDTQAGAPADPRSFGLLYQWGRKDPFLGVDGAGSTTQAKFAGTAMTLHEGQMSQEETIAQPTVLASVTGKDWCTVTDLMYWGDQEKSGKKTIYDPCPPGYRAPGRKRASIYTTDGSSIAGWKYDAENFLFQVGNPVGTHPIAGYLKYDGTYVAGTAIFWDTHMDADTPNISYCQLVENGTSKKGQMERSLGGSIRCETDE